MEECQKYKDYNILVSNVDFESLDELKDLEMKYYVLGSGIAVLER